MNNIDTNVVECEAKIVERNNICDDTTEIVFDLKDKDFRFKYGQYVEVIISEIKEDINTYEFSIASAPNKDGKIAIVFRNSESIFKKKLLSLPLNSSVSVRGPLGGKFIFSDEKNDSIVMIAGGVGIAPFMGMIRSLVSSDIGKKVRLIYSNVNDRRAPYLNELRDLDSRSDKFLLIENTGLLTEDFVRVSVDNPLGSIWYICGPPQMVLNIRDLIINKIGVSENMVRVEGYTGNLGKSKKPSRRIGLDEEIMMNLELKDLTDTILLALNDSALVAVTDARGDILYSNKKFVDVSGYSEVELLGQNHRIIKSGFHPDDFYAELWQTVSSGKVWRGEVKNQAKDGSYYWVDTNIAPVMDNGVVKYYVAVRFLITEKKQLEEKAKEYAGNLEVKVRERTKELAKEKERLGTILYSIGDGVFVIDKDFNVILLNNVASELSGFDIDEAVGSKYEKIFNFVNESSGERESSFIEKVFSTGKINEMKADTIIIRKNNEKLPVNDSAAPILDSNGNVIGCVVVFRDATKEREIGKIKEELEVAMNRFNLATNSAEIGIWEWDLKTNELIWNDQMYVIYGIEKEDFDGAYEAWEKGIHPDDIEYSRNEIQKSIDGKKDLDMVFRVVWSDETIHFLKARGIVMRNKEGDPVKMFGVNWDVTAEKEVDQAKTEFVSLASHQLRTPLAAMGWNAEMLLQGDVGDLSQEQKEFVEEIYKSNKVMNDLVNALLNTSRIDLGTFAIEPKMIKIGEIARDVLKELESQIKERNQNIIYNSDESIEFMADPNLIRIIFQNLLSNASKYTPEKGEIECEIKKDKDNVLIRVSDNGYGIPKKQQSKIFKKLFRAENILNKDMEGTGLGLYIVKAIVDASGGKIWFESDENKGTTFYVEMPLSGMKEKKGAKGLT
ncbi:MAG: PAS domain-containing protein [Candidatus Moranbacteria bacterium]|nr:PAS domain-containing protein [Candidatus Moranbacteria bacterium]